MKGNRIKKYLLYAIGEIILVAIGILIALAVNNKNEERITEDATLKTARLVLHQMKKDTTEIGAIYKVWDEYEKAIEIILTKTAPDEALPSDCDACKNVLFITELPDISSKVSDLIAHDKLMSGAVETELYKIDDMYKETVSTNKFYMDHITDALIDNLKYLKDNYSWFAQYLGNNTCNNECEDYFLNSTDFRNRVAYLNQIIYESFSFHLFKFKERITERMITLEDLINV